MNARTQISPMLAPALELARLGWHTFPVPLGSKRSHKKAEYSGGKRWGATVDPDQIARDCAKWPDANLGVMCGPESGMFGVDADTLESHGKDGLGAVAAWEAQYGPLPHTPKNASPTDGRHWFFRYPEGMKVKTSPSEVAPGIDIRGEGGMMLVAPSIKKGTDKSYRWINPPGVTPLADCPTWLLEKIAATNARPASNPAAGIQSWTANSATEAQVLEWLNCIHPDAGGYGEWLKVIMGLHDWSGGSERGLEMADTWSEGGPSYEPGEVAEKWQGFKTGGGVTLGTIAKIARDNGADLKDIARRHKSGVHPSTAHGRADKQEEAEDQSSYGQEEPNPTAPGKATSQELTCSPDATPLQLVKNRRGFAVWCHENACVTFEHDPHWCEMLAYDEFKAKTLLLKPMPGSRAPRSTFRPRELDENDVTEAVRWFNRNGYPDATKNTTLDALLLVARHTIISPVRHWLDDLKWDGKERIGFWLRDYCGAKDTAFVREAGRAWLISAVARAQQPGCKADCALILEGRQGLGKSTALRTLAGADWFCDTLRDFGNKDSSQSLLGTWIVELPELAAVRRSDVEVVKAFLSRTDERYRPAYARLHVFEPRRCVFAGTTNRSDYITDDTGGRRFWPVAVENIDVAGLARDRGQLWAEAMAAYKAGSPWWLSKEVEVEAALEVAQRTEDDPWTATILAKIETMAEVSIVELLVAIGFQREHMAKAHSMRVGGILKRAGWKTSGRFKSGPNRDSARYVRDEPK